MQQQKFNYINGRRVFCNHEFIIKISVRFNSEEGKKKRKRKKGKGKKRNERKIVALSPRDIFALIYT